MLDPPHRDYDVVVVGAGHNALVCAAYLARAGRRVGVFERGDLIGGACATRELMPGYRFDLGASTHTFIHLTPIVKDLDLERYGLHYVAVDPLFFMPFPDGTSLTMWRSVEQTCDDIARLSPVDAGSYRRFCRVWTPVARVVGDLMMTIPTPVRLARTLARAMSARRGWEAQRLPQLRCSVRQFLDATFQSDRVKAMLGWLAAQVGISPDQPGGAVFVIWQTIYHVCGIAIPRGGSGMLARALANYVEAHGGVVHTDAPVSRIVVENGRAVGVETASGRRISAPLVVSGAHIKTTARLLGDQIPPPMRRRVAALRTTNGGGVLLRIAASGLPAYRACGGPPSHTAVQLIAPSLDDVGAAWDAFRAGSRSSSPLLAVMTHSASDPTRGMAISIWAQYYPYTFKDGTVWDGGTEDLIVDEILDTLETYAPNIREVIRDVRLQSPVSFESEMGLIGGDIQHLRVSLDQMFMLRPGLRFSAYRTPIERLYLTGASTHPGGGITGMPGLNAARAILQIG